MCIRDRRNSFLQGNSITLLSAVDGRGFAETGFIINGKRVAVPQLTERFRVFTAQMVFGRSVSRDALLMTMPYSLQGLQRGAAIEITPYWVTPDGTTVYGEARTLIYEYFTQMCIRDRVKRFSRMSRPSSLTSTTSAVMPKPNSRSPRSPWAAASCSCTGIR